MTINQKKKKIKEYIDYFGGDIPDTQKIDSAKTNEDLTGILNEHENFLESLLADALTHIKEFRNKLEV